MESQNEKLHLWESYYKIKNFSDFIKFWGKKGSFEDSTGDITL